MSISVESAEQSCLPVYEMSTDDNPFVTMVVLFGVFAFPASQNSIATNIFSPEKVFSFIL